MSIKYRSDIDGLRAVAVLPVILFHAGIPGFSGGFVGVDVFFVISGYLITSIILKDIQSGKFSVTGFYERRIRRIFPALFPVIFFAIILGAFLLDPVVFRSFGKSVVATTFFASNIIFFKDAGYFDSESLTKPLLHTWSLAVEEQFYIFFPLILVAINRILNKRYLPWLIGICLVSFFVSIYSIYTGKAMAAFYLVHARAWELLFGSILALGVIPQPKTSIQRNFFSTGGLFLILFSVVFYSERTLFPGVAAIVPVLGASMFIYSGMGGGESVTGRILSLKPVVFIGLISYSLYLWHWPLIVFAHYFGFTELSDLQKWTLIVITFALAAFSQKFVEKPFRGSDPLIPDIKKLFVLAASMMVIASVAGLVIYLQRGMPYRSPEANEIIADAARWEWFENQDYGQIEVDMHGGSIPRIGDKNVKPSFLLWGDSHAMAYIPGMHDMANKYELSGYATTMSSNPPLLGINQSEILREYTFNKEVIDFIRSHPEIKTVFMAAVWFIYADDSTLNLQDIDKQYGDCKSDFQLVSVSLKKTVDTLLGMNRNVVLIEDVPSLAYDPIKAVWLSEKFKGYYRIPEGNYKGYYACNARFNRELLELAKGDNVRLLSPQDRLYDKSGHLLLVANKKLLYRNSGHLSTEGSRYVSPVFENVFREMAVRP